MIIDEINKRKDQPLVFIKYRLKKNKKTGEDFVQSLINIIASNLKSEQVLPLFNEDLKEEIKALKYYKTILEYKGQKIEVFITKEQLEGEENIFEEIFSLEIKFEEYVFVLMDDYYLNKLQLMREIEDCFEETLSLYDSENLRICSKLKKFYYSLENSLIEFLEFTYSTEYVKEDISALRKLDDINSFIKRNSRLCSILGHDTMEDFQEILRFKDKVMTNQYITINLYNHLSENLFKIEGRIKQAFKKVYKESISLEERNLDMKIKDEILKREDKLKAEIKADYLKVVERLIRNSDFIASLNNHSKKIKELLNALEDYDKVMEKILDYKSKFIKVKDHIGEKVKENFYTDINKITKDIIYNSYVKNYFNVDTLCSIYDLHGNNIVLKVFASIDMENQGVLKLKPTILRDGIQVKEGVISMEFNGYDLKEQNFVQEEPYIIDYEINEIIEYFKDLNKETLVEINNKIYCLDLYAKNLQ